MLTWTCDQGSGTSHPAVQQLILNLFLCGREGLGSTTSIHHGCDNSGKIIVYQCVYKDLTICIMMYKCTGVQCTLEVLLPVKCTLQPRSILTLL